jgi:hypothetical protein
MSRLLICALLVALPLASARRAASLPAPAAKPQLKVGAAAVAVTPFGNHPEWDGTVTESGVWGERFTDANKNGRWDAGEPFEDDEGNTALDASSKGKYDGIYLAGFGNRRLATGKHDDYWARALVIEYGATRIAIVALDFVGYYVEGSYYGTNHARALLDPKLGIGEVLVTSTHNHEGPDTTGIWGHSQTSDGKYPKYLRFVDKQIAKSITLAAQALQPARAKLGATGPRRSPSIAGMQTRTSGRPPRFFDEELRVMQFFGTSGANRNKVIATLVNWNTHPESMEDKNTEMTSDFPHAVREVVEKKYGGVAVYMSGAIGAAEIIGDTNNRNNDRIRFDGKDYPLNANSNRPVFTFERTEAIGRDIGKAAIEAIEAGEWSKSPALAVKKADLKVRIDNVGYLLLARLGVLDTLRLPAGGLGGGELPEQQTHIYAITLGDAQVVTTPGELFPEIFYGVAKYRRTDCPAADTGAPPEPAIRDAMTAKYKFMLGLCPDQFGYIVPAYDFRREPVDPARPQIRQSPDACKAQGVPNHYHETNSASTRLAPAVACVTVALLTGRVPSDAACRDAARHSDFVRRLAERRPAQ